MLQRYSSVAMMKHQQPPKQNAPQPRCGPIKLKTPQDFEQPGPAAAAVSQTSVPRSSSFVSLSQSQGSSASQLMDQSDQFFLVPGLDGALSREEFSKLTPSGSPEKPRHAEASFAEMAAARQSLCDLAEVARRKEHEWRALQELRIRGLEDAVQGREQSLQQERRRFRRTVDELTAQRRQLEQQLDDSSGCSQQLQQLQQQLQQLTQDRDAVNDQLTEANSKREEAEAKAQSLQEENDSLSSQARRLERELSEARHSGDRLGRRLEQAEQERVRAADAELQTKVALGKLEGYLREQENTLETLRAELNSASETGETAAAELRSEKARLQEQRERAGKLEAEWAASRAELEAKLADKTKKIGFLVQGIRSLESDWKERYGELRQSSAAALAELERGHNAEQQRLQAAVSDGEQRLRQAAAQAAGAQAESRRLQAELSQAVAAAAGVSRERAEERREAAQLLAARDLSLAELRGRLERQQLAAPEQSGRLLAQWQAAAGRLRQYAERVTAERDRLQRAARGRFEPGDHLQLEQDNARLAGLVQRLREELRQQQRPAGSPHCSSCGSADDSRALQLRQLLITNAKLNDTISAQSETVRTTQAELERHRAAARSTEFLRQETAYLRSLLDGPDPAGAAAAAAAEVVAPATVRELRYKLQLAARYIAHLGRERSAAQQRLQELERRLAAVQRTPSLPADLDCLRPADGGPASFAELLVQLDTMQVEPGSDRPAPSPERSPAGAPEPADESGWTVPRLVGLADCGTERSPGTGDGPGTAGQRRGRSGVQRRRSHAARK